MIRSVVDLRFRDSCHPIFIVCRFVLQIVFNYISGNETEVYDEDSFIDY